MTAFFRMREDRKQDACFSKSEQRGLWRPKKSFLVRGRSDDALGFLTPRLRHLSLLFSPYSHSRPGCIALVWP